MVGKDRAHRCSSPSNCTSIWTYCNGCARKFDGNCWLSRKHPATAKLRQIPYLGPIRSALLVAPIQTPHRFRTKRQLWAYSGLALETRTSAEYSYVEGQLRRSKKLLSIRGLNKDHNHDLKALFKAASITASVRPGPFQDFNSAGKRHEAYDGAAHTRAQDRSHYADSVEEGRRFRRGQTEIASGLSVFGEEPLPSPRIFSGGGWSVLETLGFEGEYDANNPSRRRRMLE